MAAYQQQSSRRLVGLERVLDKRRDFTQVYEALQSACDKSFELGLKLNLSYDEVKEIHTDHQTSQRRLREVIAAFLERNERPTWQDIIDALNSSLVALHALARRIDGRFSPGRLASTTSEPQPPRPSARLHLDLPDPTYTPHSSIDVDDKIEHLRRHFREYRDAVKEYIEKGKFTTEQVADCLTSASDIDEHQKTFLESHIGPLYRALDCKEQFGTMNFHWNYLDPSLLDHLLTELNLVDLKGEMETYKSDLGQFRKKTPLTLFCRAQKRKRVAVNREFEIAVKSFDWPEEVTLDCVHQFRQEVEAAAIHNTRDCAMMVHKVFTMQPPRSPTGPLRSD